MGKRKSTTPKKLPLKKEIYTGAHPDLSCARTLGDLIFGFEEELERRMEDLEGYPIKQISYPKPKSKNWSWLSGVKTKYIPIAFEEAKKNLVDKGVIHIHKDTVDYICGVEWMAEFGDCLTKGTPACPDV